MRIKNILPVFRPENLLRSRNRRCCTSTNRASNFTSKRAFSHI